MAAIFKIDGVEYDVKIPTDGCSRKAVISEGDAAGMSKAGGMIFATIGTYYNYTITVNRAGNNVADYDALYEAVTDPAVREHSVTMPYGQDTITFNAYVSADPTDKLQKVRGGVNYWGGMTLEITATEPHRLPE